MRSRLETIRVTNGPGLRCNTSRQSPILERRRDRGEIVSDVQHKLAIVKCCGRCTVVRLKAIVESSLQRWPRSGDIEAEGDLQAMIDESRIPAAINRAWR